MPVLTGPGHRLRCCILMGGLRHCCPGEGMAGQIMAGLFDCGRAGLGRAGYVKSDGICCRETARKGGMGQLYEVQACC